MPERTYTVALFLLAVVTIPLVFLLLLKCWDVLQTARSRRWRQPQPPQRPPIQSQGPQPPPQPPGTSPDVVVSGSKWEKRLNELFERANNAGDQQRTAFVAAYISKVPGLLQQIGAPDLAAAIQVRFFRPTQPNGPQGQPPPAPGNVPLRPVPKPNAPT